MFPPAQYAPNARLLNKPYPFHNGRGRTCRRIFLTDLPPSQGNTTILVVVDRFSTSCHLLPLPGLPTALQTVEALFTHVFWHYGVPEDIVSDQGAQFSSRVWKAFMEHLGVSVT